MTRNPLAGRRAENTERIRLLLDEGLTSFQICERLGLAYSTVREYIADPDGSQQAARRASYAGTCETCGAPTTGCDGPKRAPTECASCMSKRQHEERYWTSERILEAIGRFVSEMGRPPTADEWLHGTKPAWAPAVGTVQREFGSWSAGIRAAGFESYLGHKPKRGREMEGKGYVLLRETEGAWTVVGESNKPNQPAALVELLNGTSPDEATQFIAIPFRYWRPRQVRPVQKVVYEWVDAETAA